MYYEWWTESPCYSANCVNEGFRARPTSMAATGYTSWKERRWQSGSSRSIISSTLLASCFARQKSQSCPDNCRLTAGHWLTRLIPSSMKLGHTPAATWYYLRALFDLAPWFPTEYYVATSEHRYPQIHLSVCVRHLRSRPFTDHEQILQVRSRATQSCDKARISLRRRVPRLGSRRESSVRSWAAANGDRL